MVTGITRFDMADDAAGGTRRPFARAVHAGDFVFVSGQVPAVDGEIIVGDIVEKAERHFRDHPPARSTVFVQTDLIRVEANNPNEEVAMWPVFSQYCLV